MQVVKSAWLRDVQVSEAGQFGAWPCVGKIIVRDGCEVWNFEHNFSSIVKIIIIICNLSNSRSKASSKTIPPPSAI